MAEKDAGNVKGKEKGSAKRWSFLIGGISALLFAAVAAVFLNTQNSSIYEFTGKICNCRQVRYFFKLLCKFLGVSDWKLGIARID